MVEIGKRLRDVVPTLDYYELLKIKKDLLDGGEHLRDFIGSEIKQREKDHHVFCTTCGSEIDPQDKQTKTLIFGPADFKKKATFCGDDCLGYFLEKLKQKETGVKNVQTHQ